MEKLEKSEVVGASASAEVGGGGTKSYTFATGRGNFPSHVVNSLKARGNWSQIAEDGALTESNFYWR